MRRLASSILGVAFLAVFSVCAQQKPPDWDKAQIKVQKLADNLYLLQGQGVNVGLGNIAAYVAEDGIVLVDCEVVQFGPKIEAALKTISDKPVKYVLNTHWHGDHTGGDAYWGSKAVIVGQDNVRTKMQSIPDPRITNLAVSLPVITFSDQLTLHMNAEELHAVHFPHGHTDGDSIVLFAKGHVVHMGDDLTNFNPPHFPAISWENDGSGGVQGLIDAAEYVLANAPDDVQIIPGHGGLTNKEYLTKFVAMLKETSAVVQAGIDQGKTLDQLKQEKVLAKWSYLETGAIKSDFYLDRLYNSLSHRSGDSKVEGAR